MGMEPYLGEIVMFAGNFAPKGWYFCHGQTLSIAQNSPLFSLLGTTYGGDGVTTFRLPDLRGRMPVGAGQGPGLGILRNLGEAAGTESYMITTSNLPAHTHGVATTVGTETGGAAIAGVSGGAPGTVVQSGAAGSNIPIPMAPPSLGIHFIIAHEGLYPSRP